jgi:hypothetical protein
MAAPSVSQVIEAVVEKRKGFSSTAMTGVATVAATTVVQ